MEAERFCIDLLEILKNLRSEVATSRELIVSEEQHNVGESDALPEYSRWVSAHDFIIRLRTEWWRNFEKKLNI